MDLGCTKQVAGVVTQGRTGHNQYVTSYAVQLSVDAAVWVDVDGGKVFLANSAADNTRVENLFNSAVAARFVRIVVQSWNGHVSLRAAVLLSPGKALPLTLTAAPPGHMTLALSLA